MPVGVLLVGPAGTSCSTVKLPPLLRPRWIKFLLLFVLSNHNFLAQNLISASSLGVNVSLNLAVGSHFRRLGVNLHLYYVNQGFQSNSTIRAYFNLRAPGPRRPYPELVLSQGVVFGFGPTREYSNPFFSSVKFYYFYFNIPPDKIFLI